VQQTSDGGYIVVGEVSLSLFGPSQVCLVKTDSFGDTLWTRTYGGPYDESANSVRQTSDGGYIIAGVTTRFGNGVADMYLMKTTYTGDTVWTRTCGGPNEDRGQSVQQTSDGGYIIAGFTDSFGTGSADGYLVKTNSSGATLWTRTYGGADFDCINSIEQTSDGGYIAAGQTNPIGSIKSDFYLIKTQADGLVSVQGDRKVIPTEFALEQNYPNPFNPVTIVKYTIAGAGGQGPGVSDVKITVCDVLGREVAVLVNERKAPGNYDVTFDGSRLSSGIYIYRMIAGGFVQARKMLLIR
jgi:hypothetical protein